MIIDIGSNGTNLVLTGRGAQQGNCIDALGQSVIGQVSACNAVDFYRMANFEIADRLLKVPAEILRPIAVNLGVDELNFVQHITHLSRRERGMIQEFDKIIERALEINVIFPERVIRVEDQKPADHFTSVSPCPLRGETSFNR